MIFKEKNVFLVISVELAKLTELIDRPKSVWLSSVNI